MDRGAWWATVHGVAQSRTRLSDLTNLTWLEESTFLTALCLSLLVILSWRLLQCLGEGNGTPLQYSCLENPMDGGAW